MEQNEEQTPLSVTVAATDPAHIPGLTSPGAPPDQAEDQEADDELEPEAEEESADDVPSEADEAAAEGAGEAGDPADADGDGDDGDDEHGFEASDRRGSVTVNRKGVRFRLDDTEAEFDWSEVGAVEYATSRFGRRLTVTVHTRDRRSYPAEVEATAKSALKVWEAGLDAALDEYFED